MPITKDLFQRANGLIHLQPEVTDLRYSMADDGGIEAETGEFLYGLLRLLKPQFCLSTGVYSGISDMYVGQALKDNGFGHCTSIEYEQYHLHRAQELWRVVGVDAQLGAHLGSSLDYQPDRNYDFIFLDTEPGIRFQELEKFFPFLNEGGFLAIHDLPRNLTQGNVNPDHPDLPSWPFGPLPREIKKWVKNDQLRVIHLPAPRGLVLFYKTKAEDFKWL